MCDPNNPTCYTTTMTNSSKNPINWATGNNGSKNGDEWCKDKYGQDSSCTTVYMKGQNDAAKAAWDKISEDVNLCAISPWSTDIYTNCRDPPNECNFISACQHPPMCSTDNDCYDEYYCDTSIENTYGVTLNEKKGHWCKSYQKLKPSSKCVVRYNNKDIIYQSGDYYRFSTHLSCYDKDNDSTEWNIIHSESYTAATPNGVCEILFKDPRFTGKVKEGDRKCVTGSRCSIDGIVSSVTWSPTPSSPFEPIKGITCVPKHQEDIKFLERYIPFMEGPGITIEYIGDVV